MSHSTPITPEMFPAYPDLHNANRPPCFEPLQWNRWREALYKEEQRGNPKRDPLPPSSSYCTDCTAEYQQRMCTAGKCLHPDVTFVSGGHGFVDGVRPEATRIRPERTPPVLTKAQLLRKARKAREKLKAKEKQQAEKKGRAEPDARKAALKGGQS